jgi:acyl dehydratase
MSTEGKRYWFEDFPEGSVREFGGITLGREDILAFARQYDPQPFHVDEEAARHTAFGGLVASGWQTCALVTRMACDAFLLDTATAGSPGIESVRWLKPVRPGDTLRVRMRTLEARPLKTRPQLGLVLVRYDVLNQRDESVLTMDGKTMMFRRTAVAAVPSRPPAGAR